jgi:hypothetical protein
MSYEAPFGLPPSVSVSFTSSTQRAVSASSAKWSETTFVSDSPDLILQTGGVRALVPKCRGRKNLVPVTLLVAIFD